MSLRRFIVTESTKSTEERMAWIAALRNNPKAPQEELRRAADEGARVMVLSHPNCPLDYFLLLAHSRPLIALQSPYLPLLQLEAPEQWMTLQLRSAGQWILDGLTGMETACGGEVSLSEKSQHRWAVRMLRRALPLFQAICPKNGSVEDAIEAREKYANGTLSEKEFVNQCRAARGASQGRPVRAHLIAKAAGMWLGYPGPGEVTPLQLPARTFLLRKEGATISELLAAAHGAVLRFSLPKTGKGAVKDADQKVRDVVRQEEVRQWNEMAEFLLREPPTISNGVSFSVTNH